ncbi:MAG: hypothetical protein HYT11_00555, partial [Candidatus Levybacteria bacterium]|nr:hypothetical protein [Candidatus Levybacteria bacterium]
MTNQEIAKLFRDIATAYTIKNEGKYRFQIIAYQKTSDAITNSPVELKDLYAEKKLEELPGVGPSIRAHLEELFKTGHVEHFDWVLKGIPRAVFPLLDIPTFGPKKSYKLVVYFKLKNPNTVISDLENLAKKGKIASLEGFGEKSEQDIIRAINEFRLGKGKTTRMVLPYAYELAQKMVNYLKKSEYALQAFPLGSLRRMSSTIGDIDIAVASDNPKEVINHFITYPHKERIIEKGTATASILISGGRQIDLMIQPQESFGSLLQHFTGSKNHNIHLREYALKKGLSLSEYGIKSQISNLKSQISKFDTEEKFYKALGLQWIPPEIREDTGEIELAAQNNLPKLIELSDIKGDFHIHSSFPIEPSHDLGENSMEEMVRKAKNLKYEYLGFSEHNPSISKHSAEQTRKIIEKRSKLIEQVKLNNKSLHIFSLLEIDILPNGDLALDNKSLGMLDAAIISIHSSFAMDKNTMTKRVLKALSHPKTKILAHPTGRLYNKRGGFELEWKEIFDFCKKY